MNSFEARHSGRPLSIPLFNTFFNEIKYIFDDFG